MENFEEQIESNVNICEVINFGVPHIAEQIFQNCDTVELTSCLSVSETWKVLIENVLLQRWRGKMEKACADGHTKVVKILLDHSVNEDCNSTFFKACRFGRTEIVKLFMKHSQSKNINWNAQMIDGSTAFDWACVKGIQML